MTTAAEHPAPRVATINGRPLPTVLADTVARFLAAAVLDGQPTTTHEPGPPPEPTDEEP